MVLITQKNTSTNYERQANLNGGNNRQSRQAERLSISGGDVSAVLTSDLKSPQKPLRYAAGFFIATVIILVILVTQAQAGNNIAYVIIAPLIAIFGVLVTSIFLTVGLNRMKKRAEVNVSENNRFSVKRTLIMLLESLSIIMLLITGALVFYMALYSLRQLFA